MKETKKLKRILAVMTATVTMTGMFSVTAMAVGTEEAGSDPAITSEAQDGAKGTVPKVGGVTGTSGEIWGGNSGTSDPFWDESQPSYRPGSEFPEESNQPSYRPDPGDYPLSSEKKTSTHSSTEVTYDPLQIIEEQTEHYYVKGSGEGVTITCNGEFSKFFSVFINGAILEKSYYTVDRGSTVLTIMPEYLETLPVGAHTVTMNYTYGSVDTILNIAENAPNVENVSTDSGNSVSTQADNYASAGSSNTASTVNSAPQTGDTSAILLWPVLAAVSGCGCAVLIRRKE